MVAPFLHGSGGLPEGVLPLSREVAVVTLAIGVVVFAVIAYDAYRAHWR